MEAVAWAAEGTGVHDVDSYVLCDGRTINKNTLEAKALHQLFSQLCVPLRDHTIHLLSDLAMRQQDLRKTYIML